MWNLNLYFGLEGVAEQQFCGVDFLGLFSREQCFSVYMYTQCGVYVYTQSGVYTHTVWGVCVTQHGDLLLLCSGDGYYKMLSSFTILCLNTLLNYIYLFCVYVCICTFELCVCVTSSMEWRPEDNLWDSVLSAHHVGPGAQTQVLRFGRHCYCLTPILPAH